MTGIQLVEHAPYTTHDLPAAIGRALAASRIVDAAPGRFASVEAAQLDHDEAITGLYESMSRSQLDVDEALVTMYELSNAK